MEDTYQTIKIGDLVEVEVSRTRSKSFTNIGVVLHADVAGRSVYEHTLVETLYYNTDLYVYWVDGSSYWIASSSVTKL